MDPMIIQNQLRSITGPEAAQGVRFLNREPMMPEQVQGRSFGEILTESIDQVNDLHHKADNAIEKIATGQSGNVHGALIALQEAEISMRLLLEVRNKVLNAYQEVMRTQI